jgi:hypothetical protein
MLKLEKWFVNSFDNKPPLVRELLKYWTEVKGYGKHGIKFNCNWGRRSGDMWTSSFNSMINLCISKFIFGDGLFIAKGDDGFLGVDSDLSIEEISSKYLELGMIVKIKEISHISELSYCSGSFYPTARGWKWGVNPFRILAKFGVNYHHHPKKNLKSLLKGTVISMLPISGHVPLLSELFNTLKDSDVKAILPKDEPWKTSSSQVDELTPEAVDYFLLKYGWTLDDYLNISRQLSALTLDDFPIVLTHPLFHRGFSVDSGSTLFQDTAFTARDKELEEPSSWEILDALEILSPLLEEVVKTYSFTGMMFIILLECIGTRSVLPLIVHFAFYMVSTNLFIRIGVHYFYNYVVVIGVGASLIGLLRKNQFITNKKRISGSKKTSRAIKKMVRQMAKTAIIDASAGVGGVAGGYLGNSKQGTRYGRKAGSWLSKVTGMGDYHINSNTLVKGNSVPAFARSGRGVRIAHREFLGDIESGTSFVSTEFDLNPGLQSSFPWLSTIAQNFQQYEFHGLLFEFKSTSAVALNSTNTALGVNIFATQYNSLDDSFVNKVEMENYEYSTSACPAESMIHPIECAPFEKTVRMQYVRSGAVPSGEDARFYDLGRTTIASVGAQEASICGELWVTYDVEFFKPRLVAGSYSSLFDKFSIGAYSNTDILGVVIPASDGNLGGSISATGSGYDTYNFPVNMQAGYYKIALQWAGSSTGSLALTHTATNCTALNAFELDTANLIGNGSTTSARFFYELIVQVTARSAKIVFSSATLPTSGSSVDLTVIQMGNPL